MLLNHYFLSSSFCQGRCEKGTGKKLKLAGNIVSSCQEGQSQELALLPLVMALRGVALKVEPHIRVTCKHVRTYVTGLYLLSLCSKWVEVELKNLHFLNSSQVMPTLWAGTTH